MNPNFNSLPPELHYEMSRFMPAQSIAHMVGTSRQFQSIYGKQAKTTKDVYEMITIAFTQFPIRHSKDHHDAMIAALSAPKDDFQRAIRVYLPRQKQMQRNEWNDHKLFVEFVIALVTYVPDEDAEGGYDNYVAPVLSQHQLFNLSFLLKEYQNTFMNIFNLVDEYFEQRKGRRDERIPQARINQFIKAIKENAGSKQSAGSRSKRRRSKSGRKTTRSKRRH